MLAKPFDPMTLAARARSETQEQILVGLRGRFRDRAHEDRTSIVAFLLQPAAAAVAEINAAAHKMAGIAASLGYPDLGRCAAAIDARSVTYPADSIALQALASLVRQVLRDCLTGIDCGR